MLNQNTYVAGLREGCALHVEGDRMFMKGIYSLRIFRYNCEPREIPAGDDLSFLLKP
jgi:dipeptidase E